MGGNGTPVVTAWSVQLDHQPSSSGSHDSGTPSRSSCIRPAPSVEIQSHSASPSSSTVSSPSSRSASVTVSRSGGVGPQGGPSPSGASSGTRQDQLGEGAPVKSNSS